MKVHFRVPKGHYPPLGKQISMEGVGYDPDQSCCKARLKQDSSGCPVWVTAFSQFSYILHTSVKDWEDWSYEGALNGFLRQNLLPLQLKQAEEKGEFEILSFSGTYGWSLPGNTPRQNMEDYLRVKSTFQKLVEENVVPSLTGLGIEISQLDSYDHSRISAGLWEWYSRASARRKEGSPVVDAIFHSRSPLTQWAQGEVERLFPKK